MRKKILNILLLFFVTSICLIFAEFIVRKIVPATVYTDERNLAYRYDSELGWFPKISSQMQFQGSRTINVKHNSLGFRDIEPKDNNKPNIIFLGDSFTWGYDVEAGERFTEKLRKEFANKFNILNFGVSGYGTDQEFLLLQRYFDKFKPKKVFVIFCDNDFDNNLKNVVYHGYYKPYFIYQDGKLNLKGVPVKLSTNYKMLTLDSDHPILAQSHIVKWTARLIGRAQYNLAKKTLKSDPTYHILENMNQFLRERNSELVVGTINYYPEMEKFFVDKGISYVNLNNSFRYTSHGGHWTSQGHEFAANKIANHLNNLK